MMLASVRLLRVNTDSFIPGCKLEEGKRADREHEGEKQDSGGLPSDILRKG